ncbi:MAG: hypothetical protein MJ202_11135 [Lentisphaeria bacterium]|nr:hypothetical protein [Lentisphaeria bacterium]
MTPELLHKEYLPSQVLLEFEGGEHLFVKISSQLTWRDMALELQVHEDDEGHPSLKVFAMAEKSEIRAIRLIWRHDTSVNCRFTGDAWNATQGECQWRGMDPLRVFPWYVLVRANEETVALGVKTQGAAFASWTLNPSQVTLTLDLRNGACGVQLDGRVLEAATVFYCRYDRTPMAAARRFCGILSPDSITSNLPVYGILSKRTGEIPFTTEDILQECDLLAFYCNNLTNRPFQILDCGWQNEALADMTKLAGDILHRGVRPGLSLPLLHDNGAMPDECRLPHRTNILDPSLPQVLEAVQAKVRQIADWGFELLRHTSSTQDCLNGIYENLRAPAEWSFADRKRTNAEILVDFYRAIKSAKGDMLLYGEDVIGHLAAGLLHICRVTSADTADWLANRHNRINALAFRLCQNEKFFTLDTGTLDLATPRKWQEVKPLAELLSQSGTAFFVSLDKTNPLSAKAAKELSQNFFNASLGDITSLAPTDWFNNTCPEQWTIGNTSKCYHWFEN